MVHLKYLVVFFLMLINCTECKLNHFIHRRVEIINNNSKIMYGGVRKDNVRNDFELEKIMYPRGDIRKLSELSQAWRDYYVCLAEQFDTVSTARLLPNILMMVFQGAVARLPCSLCLAPSTTRQVMWQYAKSTEAGDFSAIEGNDRLTIEHGTMTIYNVIPDDGGVYRCKYGASSGGLVIMEVVDDEIYSVVKPPTSRGPHTIAPEIYQGVMIFSQWSPWSECSVCDRVGRRRRYGVCYVKLDQDLIVNYEIDPVETTIRTNLYELDDKLIEMFQAFPDGLPCRSKYLPQTLKDLDAIQRRPSEIMIGMCKVPCEDTTSKTNEARNATQGNTEEDGTLIYPLTRTDSLPKQPPLPVRNTIFADFGQRFVIRCPGTTLRDVPILWRVGTKRLVPRGMNEDSGGRVYLDCRDHLVLTTVLYSDENLYSCWQRDNLAGTVKLIVWEGAHVQWNHHVTLPVLVILAAIVLRVMQQGVRSIQRRQDLMYQ